MADEQNEKTLRIFIETPSGDRFEADIPCDTKINQVAVDFFEAQGWPVTDRLGHGQRAVVELVNPENPDNTKRLNSNRGICESGLRDGDTLRIIPESRAGAVDQRARLAALTMDYNEMQVLSQQNPQITFTVNRTQAPDLYNLALHYTSFVELLPHESEPCKNDPQTGPHRVEIMLGALYPRHAPIVTWQTPIFHPNILQVDTNMLQSGGTVCLGALRERYLPGMGLARLVRMLVEMLQWRNFDAYSAINPQAAEWAARDESRSAIEAIGGHPLLGPIEEYIKQLDRATHPLIIFRRLSPDQ
jgi:ubiquitin-protein ligase